MAVLKIACVRSAQEVPPFCTVIVFPEGAERLDLQQASIAWPTAVVVGAFADRGYSRGVLLRRGRLLVSYLKVLSDGRTHGSGNAEQMPVFEDAAICVGLVVCMDVDHVKFAAAIRARVLSSPAPIKVLCIPADMGDYWFSGDMQYTQFAGMHVALCNNTTTHLNRYKSFVTDTGGRKAAVQRDVEPVTLVPNGRPEIVARHRANGSSYPR